MSTFSCICKRSAVTSLFLAATILTLLVLHPRNAWANPFNCTDPNRFPQNLTRNGSVGSGYETPYGIVAEWWNVFIYDGPAPRFELVDNENANGDYVGEYSQYIHGDGYEFDAGLYQVISGVKPGYSYEFSVGMAQTLRDLGGGRHVRMDDIGRRVGVDPFGGTDPHSPNLIWGPAYWSGGAGLNKAEMALTFVAQAEQVTVFVRAFNRNPSASDKVWFDVMCLLPREDIPPVAVPTTTPPPTEPPPAVAASAQQPPTRAPVVRPTRTPTPRPTDTPEPARVMTATPKPEPRRSPTASPEPRPFIPLADPNVDGSNSGGGTSGASILSLVVILGSLGFVLLSALGIVLILAFAFWRLFVRPVGGTLDSTHYSDEAGRSR